jgi:hypothetical protein
MPPPALRLALAAPSYVVAGEVAAGPGVEPWTAVRFEHHAIEVRPR